MIRAKGDDEGVVAETTEQDVGAGTAGKGVVAGAAVDAVGVM
jgi:hypothetical protein